MKESELRKHTDCSLCGKKVLASGLPLFWRVKIERFGIKMNAVSRQQGLTMMLGGHALLAQIMGADEDMAEPVMDAVTLTICENCACNNQHVVAGLAEMGKPKEA